MNYATMWSYPWDVIDEGSDYVVKMLKEEIGLDGLSVAATYHTCEQLRPHLPGRSLFVADKAACYFQPQWDLYEGTPIRPFVSPLAQRSNPMKEIASSCRKFGLDLISWTLCLHNSYLATSYPECAEQTVFGDRLSARLCPANPAVREYMKALAVDISTNYGISRLELESLDYAGYGHHHFHVKDGVRFGLIGYFLMGLCFCDHCLQRAVGYPVDTDRLENHVRSLLGEIFSTGKPLEGDIVSFLSGNPDMERYVAMRVDTVTSLLEEIKKAVEVEVSYLFMRDRFNGGVEPKLIASMADKVEILGYTSSPDSLEGTIRGALASLDDPSRLIVGIQSFFPAAPSKEVLKANIQRSLQLHIQQFSFYNYGIMPMSNLTWVRDVVRMIHSVN